MRCENFQISRGVLQGDVVSPLFFILALEAILRRHDPIKTGQGVPLAEIFIRLLGYADDVAVTEEGDDEGVARVEDRVNCIADGSEEDADMKVNAEKTVVMHVRAQDKTSVTTPEEAKAVCKYCCPHLNCDFHFMSKHGMQVHTTRCE